MSGLTPPNVLSYIGQVVVPFINRTFPPTTSFNDFTVPTIWVDTNNENAYILVAKPMGVAQWILIGGTPGNVDTLTADSGGAIAPIANNINIFGGTGINTVGTAGTITINTSGASLDWIDVTGPTQQMVAGQGYFADSGAQITFTLPITAAAGSATAILGIAAGHWTIVENASQQVIVGSRTSTATTGSVTATAGTDNILLICVIANTKFAALSWSGNLTVI